ncbi:MAG: hypothetical protein UT84_C0034G0007 [Candidatus Curtissbacteria bacterium GW2011_GWA1_40_16]|uniref:Membrane protein insertion efficiency factor n=1 Tax=Candidatus Curtissbacteria bacterium GW2011_GWA1_40_16 TaxID=1618405 RepID=A0A0G0R8D5_9BACT|nr:MAG: hypothetical protein UT84_C0034G0007 [Candidatus Curtissbacteria bacterium GW2011_GWA1_40_16]
MIKVVNFLFVLYRLIFGTSVATCRFRPTCSAYAVDSIEKYGVLEGTWMTLKRLSSCHPFSKRPIYDPV